jgi:arylsulfatase
MMSKQPNILFIMTDQFRSDALGVNGGWAKTPNLDKIAEEGTNFTRCYTNSPVCMPARLSLATGRYPHNTNIWLNCTTTMPAKTPTWMQAVRAAGYRTSVYGKTHLYVHEGDLRDRESLLNAYGMDDIDEIGGPGASSWVMSHMTNQWKEKGLLEPYREDYNERVANKKYVARPSVLPFEENADVYVAQKAIEYLEAYEKDQPWCCWVSFGGPHEPWDAPDEYSKLYNPNDMPPPVKREDADRNTPAGHLYERLASPKSHPDFLPGEIGALRANYAGKVTLIDEQIGRIIKLVEEKGELENTVIIFTSDHGELNGDYGLIFKETFLDGSARIPMIVRIPGAKEGIVHRKPVELLDVGPTLVELAGGVLEHNQFGVSLVPVVKGGNTPPREDALSELRGEFMLATEQWKIALNNKGEAYLLFDLSNDPRETRNLAGSAEVRAVEEHLKLRILERVVSSQINEPRLAD